MPLPDLSPYPTWAQVLIYSILGISIAAAFLVTRFGIAQGQKAAPTGAGQAQVAAVIVDPTALNAATAAVEGLVVAVTESNVIARVHAKSTERLAKAAEELGEGVEKLRDQAVRLEGKMK